MTEELPASQDWTRVLDFLQPKMPLYCPEIDSMTIPQKVFLHYEGKEALFGGQAGGGKATESETPLLTVAGWTTVGEVRPGQSIYGRDGKPYEVLAVSETMIVPGWRLTFDDGTEVTCNDEHLWRTFDHKELLALTCRTPEWKARRRAKRPSRATGSRGELVTTLMAAKNSARALTQESLPLPHGTIRRTDEIVATIKTANGRNNHAIPVAKPLEISERTDLDIPPYTFGAWLGDGSKASGTICGADQEVFDNIQIDGFTIRLSRTAPTSVGGVFNVYRIENLTTLLRELNVLNNKHVPVKYLLGSEDQRLALLQGLMDTDGTVAKNSGSAEFCNTNKNIIDAVAFLVRSLGMKCSVRSGRAKLKGRDCGPKWTIKFVANRIVFRLSRKVVLQKVAARRTTQFRYLVNAERVKREADALP